MTNEYSRLRSVAVLVAVCLASASMPLAFTGPTVWERKITFLHNTGTSKYRDQICGCSGHLKHFRGFATRYDRRAIHFIAFVYLAVITCLQMNADRSSAG